MSCIFINVQIDSLGVVSELNEQQLLSRPAMVPTSELRACIVLTFFSYLVFTHYRQRGIL